jgi:hypothetical protein
VFRLALRQTEGLIGSIIGLLGLDLPVPDHTTLSRRAATLELPRPKSSTAGAGREAEPVHLLVDSTGLKLGGPGEWLVEKHGTQTRRSWRKLHIGLDADTGQIVASALTDHNGDDGAQVGPLLDQVAGWGQCARSPDPCNTATQRRILSWVTAMPRADRSSSTSRKLSVNRRYIQTARWTISGGKR